MKLDVNNIGTELRSMHTGFVGQERFADAVDADLRGAAPKSLFSRIIDTVAELFSEKHQARAIVAHAKSLSEFDGAQVYTSFRDILGNSEYSET